MGLGSFIKAAVGLFSKRDNGVTLTPGQAEHVLKLVKKERNQIERQMHDVVDKGALEGKTIPVSTICVIREGATKEERAAIEQVMQELMDKYGENIPVNTAHRLSQKLDGVEKVWNDKLGCHERQLQRRDGSPFFPFERRIVTIQEILDAQEKDSELLTKFKEKFKIFYSKSVYGLEQNNSPSYAFSFLQETQNMLEEAAAVGGPLEGELNILQTLEESLIKALNLAMPDSAKLLEETRTVSVMARIPFLAQHKNNRIPVNEIAPSLLAESLDIIATMGAISRAMPNSKPNDADIKTTLEEAVQQGISRQRAGKIIAAWAGYL